MTRNNQFIAILFFTALTTFSITNAQSISVSERNQFIERDACSGQYNFELTGLNKKKLHKLLKLFNAVERSYLPDMLHPVLTYLKNAKFSVDCDNAWQTLMIAVTMKVARFVEITLLEDLDLLDKHITYWRSQGNSSVRYFFSQSPITLITGKSQYQEIGRKLRHLKKVQKKYFILLGRLKSQLNTFDQTVMAQQKREWMNDLTVVMQKIPFIQSRASIASGLTGSVKPLQSIIRRLLRHELKIEREIGFAAIPKYFTVRNMLIATTVASVALYLYCNPHIFSHLKGKTTKAWDNFYKKNIAGPFDLIKDALWGSGWHSDSELDEISNDFKKVMQKIIGTKAVRDDLSASNRSNINKQNYESYKNNFEQLVMDYFKNQGLSNDELKEIKAMAKENDLRILEKIFLKVTQDFKGQYWFGGKKGSLEIMIRIIMVFSMTLKWRAVEFGGDVSEPMQKLSTFVKRLADQTQLTAALAALVPAGLGVVGSYYLCKKIIMCCMPEKYNFRYMRFILHDLHHLLNTHPNYCMHEMDLESQGKLTFYIDKLKRDVYRYVRYDQQYRILGDIKTLASPKLSSQQKLETVHGIWNTYSVLKAGYRRKRG